MGLRLIDQGRVFFPRDPGRLHAGGVRGWKEAFMFSARQRLEGNSGVLQHDISSVEVCHAGRAGWIVVQARNDCKGMAENGLAIFSACVTACSPPVRRQSKGERIAVGRRYADHSKPSRRSVPGEPATRRVAWGDDRAANCGEYCEVRSRSLGAARKAAWTRAHEIARASLPSPRNTGLVQFRLR